MLSIECRIFCLILAFSFSLHTSCSKCFLMSHFWFFIKCDLFIYFSLSVTLCILLDSYIIIIVDLLCLVCLSVATFAGMVYLIHVLVCKSLPLIFNQLMNFLKNSIGLYLTNLAPFSIRICAKVVIFFYYSHISSFVFHKC